MFIFDKREAEAHEQNTHAGGDSKCVCFKAFSLNMTKVLGELFNFLMTKR